MRVGFQEPAQEVLKRLPGDARYFLFHIDLTRPGDLTGNREELAGTLECRGVRVLNSKIVDVSKRNIQRICQRAGLNCTLAEQSGDPGELLIVKSDLNCGGVSERQLSPRLKRKLGVSNPPEMIRHMMDYKVMARLDVPEAWWENPALVMERFIRNKANRSWRFYLFLDRLVVSEVVAMGPIKKGADVIQRLNSFVRLSDDGYVVEERRSHIPSAAMEQAIGLIRAAGLHFGAIDVVGDDAGRYYAIDLATTAGEPTFPLPRAFQYLRSSVGVTLSERGPLSAMKARWQAELRAGARRWIWRHF